MIKEKNPVEKNLAKVNISNDEKKAFQGGQGNSIVVNKNKPVNIYKISKGLNSIRTISEEEIEVLSLLSYDKIRNVITSSAQFLYEK